MWQPGWEGSVRENGYMYMCSWIPLLSTWNYHNIVNWLYSNIMATHSSILSWRIPWTEEPDGLQSMGLCRVGQDLVTNIFQYKIKSFKKAQDRNISVNSSFCCSVSQSCLTLWNTMDCSMPGFPVLHCLLEFVRTQVHWVDEVIQPSHPLSPLLLLPSIFPNSTRLKIKRFGFVLIPGTQKKWKEQALSPSEPPHLLIGKH